MTVWSDLKDMHDLLQRAVVIAGQARDQYIGVAGFHHQCAEQIAVAFHQAFAVALQIAAALHTFVEHIHVGLRVWTEL